METLLSASTTRKWANLAGGGRPRMPARKAADRCWSRHETMVWFSCTLTLVILPSLLAREQSRPGGLGADDDRAVMITGSQRTIGLRPPAPQETRLRRRSPMPGP